jgi:hypothetical protein
MFGSAFYHSAAGAGRKAVSAPLPEAIRVGFDDPPRLARGATTEKGRLAPYRRVSDEIAEFIVTFSPTAEMMLRLCLSASVQKSTGLDDR